MNRRWCAMLLSLFAGTTLAGNPPPCYVMTQGPSGAQYQWLDPDDRGVLVNMVLADASNYNTGGWLSATATAQKVADRIRMRRSTFYPQNSLDPQGAPLPDNRICICFTKFGVDNRACDFVPAGNPDPGARPWFDSTLRYFHEVDKIPGIDETQDFPVDRTDNDILGLADNRSARTYRHPFLHNATEASPLRDWMQEFVDEYKNIQLAANNDGNPYNNLPNPDRFYFDTETLMTWAGGKDGWSRNQVYILEQLATRNDASGQPYWTKQLPGHPAGTTLATLYAAAASAYGWPTDIFDSAQTNPTLNHGLNSAFPAEDVQHNHRFMVWYAGICNKVQDHIMKFCAYDVIKAAWPEHPILVGNYFDAKMDNAYDATGWHMGWEDPVAHTTRTPVNVIRRGWVDPFWSGGHGWTMFLPAELGFLPPPAGVTESGRFLTIEHAASGDVDMPELYPLAHEQWLGEFSGGYGDDAGDPCHQQLDLYRANGLTTHESRRTATLRMSRHEAESTIGSRGTWSGGQAIDPAPANVTLVPWVHLATTDGEVTEEYVVEHLALARSKHAKELVFFSGYNPQKGCSWYTGGGTPPAPPTPGPNDDPRTHGQFPDGGFSWPETLSGGPYNGNIPGQDCDILHLIPAWKSAEDAVLRVYTPELVSIEEVIGTFNHVGPPLPNTLDFTLRSGDPEADFTMLVSEDISSSHFAQVQVNFDSVPRSTAYTIVVEADIDLPDCTGTVEVYDWTSQGWVIIPRPEEGGSGLEFSFWTPPDASGRRTMRWVSEAVESASQDFVKTHLTGTNNNGQMRVRVAFLGFDGYPIHPRIDLVQVIPHDPPTPRDGGGGNTGGGGSGGSSAPAMMPPGDANHSGETTIDDLLLYTAAYLEGGTLADMDQDDDVNATDLAAYLDQYNPAP